MAKKIFWTQSELSVVYAEMVEELKRNPLLRKEQVMQLAQRTLPVERRRNLYGSAIYRYHDLINKARAEAKKPPPEPSPPPAQPVAQPDLLRAILDQLLDALVDKLVERIELRPQEFGGIRIKHDPQPVAAERPSKTGVLIIGLLNQQAQTIINSFPNLEVTCLTTEEALKREPIRRSQTILMTKFISHAVQEKYRRASCLRLCNGGVSELSALLKSIS